MHELANPLVAWPSEPETLRLCTDAAVHLGDRNPSIVESIERVEEAGRDPRRECEHESSVAAKTSHVCAIHQVTRCYLVSSATVSTCGVCGNMSTGVTRSSRYPHAASSFTFPASVVGLHET